MFLVIENTFPHSGPNDTMALESNNGLRGKNSWVIGEDYFQMLLSNDFLRKFLCSGFTYARFS